MGTTSLRFLPVIAAAAVLFSCSRGDRGAEAASVGGIGIPADAAPSDARLIRLVDQRVAIALARNGATWTVSSGPERLREELALAARAARAPGASGEGAGARPELEPVAQQIDALALRADDVVAPGPDGGAFAQQVREVLDQLVAAAGTAVGDAGTIVETVRLHIANAIAIVEEVGRARGALAQIASGEVPDFQGYAYDDYLYETRPELQRIDGPDSAPDRGGSVFAAAEHETYRGLRVDVLELRRTSDGMVTLNIAIVNETGGPVRLIDSNLLGVGPHTWTMSGVGLIDLGTGTRYTVMHDNQKKCLCSEGGAGNQTLEPGERREFWARYDSVTPTVRTVSLDVPGFRLIDGVPISG